MAQVPNPQPKQSSLIPNPQPKQSSLIPNPQPKQSSQKEVSKKIRVIPFISEEEKAQLSTNIADIEQTLKKYKVKIGKPYSWYSTNFYNNVQKWMQLPDIPQMKTIPWIIEVTKLINDKDNFRIIDNKGGRFSNDLLMIKKDDNGNEIEHYGMIATNTKTEKSKMYGGNVSFDITLAISSLVNYGRRTITDSNNETWKYFTFVIEETICEIKGQQSICSIEHFDYNNCISIPTGVRLTTITSNKFTGNNDKQSIIQYIVRDYKGFAVPLTIKLEDENPINPIICVNSNKVLKEHTIETFENESTIRNIAITTGLLS